MNEYRLKKLKSFDKFPAEITSSHFETMYIPKIDEYITKSKINSREYSSEVNVRANFNQITIITTYIQ